MHVTVSAHLLGRSLEFNRVVEIYSSCFMIRRFVLVLYSASSIEVLLPAVIFPHLRVNILHSTESSNTNHEKDIGGVA